jgi:type III pantothenate kinase
MKRLLLIDNSNSRTKLAIGTADGIDAASLARIPTSEVSAESLDAALTGAAYDAVVIASVVPEKARILRGYFDARAIPVHAIGADSPLGIGIDYPTPAQIGADRLANAVGVVARHGAPAIVIDFGTAVTFDVISAAPAYCGGVIAPGLGAMTGYLTARTALLPAIDLAEPTSAIGKSTVEAMRAGAVIGYRGLVRGIVEALQREIDGRPVIIATGGDGALIASGLPEIDAFDADITLDGIRRIGLAVFPEQPA